MTWEHQQFLADVAASALWAPDYAEDVLVRLAQNSASIEGNTLTIQDTITLLVDDRAPGGKTLRELYEVANHRQTLSRILTAVCENEPLSVAFVQDLHATLMDHLAFDRGEFKTSENRISGASFLPLPPSKVSAEMHAWSDQVEWQTANLDGPDLLAAIAASHIQFERIHPFSDGNGRTGRAVLAYQTIRRFGFPAIVRADDKPDYIRMLDARDEAGIANMLLTALAFESERFLPAS